MFVLKKATRWTSQVKALVLSLESSVPRTGGVRGLSSVGSRLFAPDSGVAKTGHETGAEAGTVAKREESENVPKKVQPQIPGLMAFFDDPKNWGVKEVKSGRSWRMDELRIKSNSDLHKLWFVLLKERNMLKTMEATAESECELFPSPERLDKVEESMRNLEDVVRERNRAYWELEVGEGTHGEAQTAYRRDQFGRHRTMTCSEHLIPFWMNSKWRALYGPGHGKEVNEFLDKLREKKARRLKRHYLYERYTVRQLLRRFPDMDLEYLQEKYPQVPVDYLKDNLNKYKERRYISLGTQNNFVG
jgi:large subunit ribosomal protein L47